jgi:hypothetical protein
VFSVRLEPYFKYYLDGFQVSRSYFKYYLDGFQASQSYFKYYLDGFHASRSHFKQDLLLNVYKLRIKALLCSKHSQVTVRRRNMAAPVVLIVTRLQIN